MGALLRGLTQRQVHDRRFDRLRRDHQQFPALPQEPTVAAESSRGDNSSRRYSQPAERGAV